MKIKDALTPMTTLVSYLWQGGKLNTITAVTATAAAYEYSPELVGLMGAIFSPEVAAAGATGGAGAVIAGLLALMRIVAGYVNKK